MGGSQLVGGARLPWDFVQPDDIAATLSTVVDIGLRFDLTPAIQFGLAGDSDGIGDDFMTFRGVDFEEGVAIGGAVTFAARDTVPKPLRIATRTERATRPLR